MIRNMSPDDQNIQLVNSLKGNLSEIAKAFQTAIYSERISKTVEEALKSKIWKQAMEDEINVLNKNGTWEKCTIPKGKRVVDCK